MANERGGFEDVYEDDFDYDDDDTNHEDDGFEFGADPENMLRKELRPQQPLDTELSATGLFPIFALRAQIVFCDPRDGRYRIIRNCGSEAEARQFLHFMTENGAFERLPRRIH